MSNKNFERRKNSNSGMSAVVATYANKIANKYRNDRGMSAQGSNSMARGLNRRFIQNKDQI